MLNSNIEMLQTVASGLGELNKEVVYVGGSVTELYADLVVSDEIRPTDDVDVVIKMTTRKDYNQFHKAIQQLGFNHDNSQGAPICRWLYKGLKVDIMPVDSDIFGFSNQWYKLGFAKCIPRVLPNGATIYIFPLSIYLASKLEAVLGRGKDDLRLSHDFEDIVYLFNNCGNILQEFTKAETEVRNYLANIFKQLQMSSEFVEAVSCALPYGSDENRISHVATLIESIIKAKE